MHPARVAALLFGSGLSALVYQIAWQRELRLVFGSSTAASAAVLTIFVGGMGAGGLLLGRRADAHPRPLRLYAALELGVALTAAVTPPLVDLARGLYLRLGGAIGLGLPAGTALRLLLSALVLAAPTFLMGGTLPAAARSVQSDADARRRSVGLLYGANTLGAVTGSCLATFWLLERLGTRTTLWSACAANAAVALLAVAVDRRAAKAEAPPADAPVTVPRAAPAPPWFVLAAAAVVGFAFFLLELVWYRMLGPLLGGSVFTFGLVLAVALLGIGAGGLGYAMIGGGRPVTLRAFALTCLFEALGVALPFALGDRLALLALALRPEGGVRLAAYLPGWAAVTAIVVLPAAFAAGAQYPLLIALLGAGRRGVGREVGAAAACNTAGAMVGSLAGGFALLPRLSATGCWRAAALLLTVLGLAALALSRRTDQAPATPDLPWLPSPRRWARVAAAPSLALASLACLVALGPTAAWRHSPIGAGRVPRQALASPIEARRWLHEARGAIVWENEDYAAVASRLEEGGLFLQWLQMYEIDEDTVRAVYRTLSAVFPHVETWRLGAGDLVLVSSRDPPRHDAKALRARTAEAPFKRALAVAWRTEGLEGVLAHYVATPAFARTMAEAGRVNTDDRNQVEFAFARHVGDFAHVDRLLGSARTRGEDRPALTGGEVSWTDVEEERIMAQAGEGVDPDVPEGLPVDVEVRAQAAVNYVAGNLGGALAKWRFQERAAVGPTEIAIVAEALADAGSDDAPAAIDRLRAFQPIEADAALARLRVHQDRRDEATEILARVFEAYRTDPWPSPAAMHRALELAASLVENDPARAAHLLDPLSRPFAVRTMEGARKLAVVWAASQIQEPEPCVAAWHDLEPWPPWDSAALASRRDCYRRAGDERRERARRDAADFVACGASPGWLGCL